MHICDPFNYINILLCNSNISFYMFEPKKIEDRLSFYLWTAPKVELYVAPAFTQTDKPFEICLEEYLEDCPYSNLVYTEFLLCDPTVLTADSNTIVRKVSRAMSDLTTGCRFSVMFPNKLSLKDNIKFSLKWRDLFIGFCVDFETFLHSNGVVRELEDSGALITAVVTKAKQLAQIDKESFPILPTDRIILQDLTAVSDKELDIIFSEILPSNYQLILSIRQDEFLLVAKKLHLLFARGICFYLSRQSTDTDPPLTDMIRPLVITLKEAGQLIHNGYEIASLSVYEKSHFLDMLRLTDIRYSIYTPPKRVAIFGRRYTKPEESSYQMAYEISLAVASKGFHVITGGYVGIMEAANAGAIQGEKKGNSKLLSEGVLCPTLFSSRLKGNDSLSKRYVTHGINQRTDKLVEESSILVVMPGSIGTFTELLVAVSMSSIDSCYHLPGFPRAVIACRDPWQSVLESSWNLMNAPDYQIDSIDFFDTAEEAVELVEKKYEWIVKSTLH